MDIPPDRTAFAGTISEQNPMGTDGFEFVEFTSPDMPGLEALPAMLPRARYAPPNPPGAAAPEDVPLPLS